MRALRVIRFVRAMCWLIALRASSGLVLSESELSIALRAVSWLSRTVSKVERSMIAWKKKVSVLG